MKTLVVSHRSISYGLCVTGACSLLSLSTWGLGKKCHCLRLPDVWVAMETGWTVGRQAKEEFLLPLPHLCHLCAKINDSSCALTKRLVGLTQTVPPRAIRSSHSFNRGQATQCCRCTRWSRYCLCSQGCPIEGLAPQSQGCLREGLAAQSQRYLREGLTPQSPPGLSFSGSLSFPAFADYLLPRCLPKALLLQGSSLNASYFYTSLLLPGALWSELPVCGGRKRACICSLCLDLQKGPGSSLFWVKIVLSLT